MNKIAKNLILVFSLMLPSIFCLADTTVVFDTITSFKSAASYSTSSISGIEKDTTNSITASFQGVGNSDGKSVAAVCTPLVLTAMEKVGRYYLHVTYGSTYITSCMLELKALPE